MDIASRISQQYRSLSGSECLVADVVLADMEVASQLSIAELAHRAGVSHATVTRFAKSLDCKNVRELKHNLAKTAALGERFIKDNPDDQDNVHIIYDSIKSALDQNAGLISTQKVSRAAELISRAHQVFAFGTGGGSTIMANECQYRLFRLGISITAYTDNVLMRMAAASMDSQDVLLCLSLSGENPELENALKVAREYDVNIVSITNIGSTIASLSDIVLPICLDETEYIYKPSAARYVMMANIDILSTELATKCKRQSQDKLRRIKQQLDDYRNSHGRYPLGD